MPNDYMQNIYDRAEATLNASPGFRTLAGRAVHIDAGERQVVVTIQ